MEIYCNLKSFSYSMGREGGGGGGGGRGSEQGQHSKNKCYKFLIKPIVFIVVPALA